MNIKSGLPEIIVPAICCAIYALVGLPWASGLVLAAGMLGFSATAALVMNYASLPSAHRSSLFSCVIAPYSTLLSFFPLVIMLPVFEHLKDDLKPKL